MLLFKKNFYKNININIMNKLIYIIYKNKEIKHNMLNLINLE